MQITKPTDAETIIENLYKSLNGLGVVADTDKLIGALERMCGDTWLALEIAELIDECWMSIPGRRPRFSSNDVEKVRRFQRFVWNEE